MNREWFRRNDIGRKLEAAVNDLINGDGWDVFAGLEEGETTVKVVYDGLIRFVKVERPKPFVAPDVEITVYKKPRKRKVEGNQP